MAKSLQHKKFTVEVAEKWVTQLSSDFKTGEDTRVKPEINNIAVEGLENILDDRRRLINQLRVLVKMQRENYLEDEYINAARSFLTKTIGIENE